MAATRDTGVAPPAIAPPVSLAVAETAAHPDPFPKPDFNASPPLHADATPAALAELAAASAIGLTKIPASATAQPIATTTETPDRSGYADTSPRLPSGASPNFTADDELILQLQSAHGEIADTIVAYGTRSGVYLPLGDVARFLDLAIVVSDDGHYASGWFLDEKQTLSINLRAATLVVAGKELTLAKDDAAAFEGELYVRADRFADLLPLNLAVDLRAQTVTVKTRSPFPFEQRLAREDERQRLEGGVRERKRFPQEATPWLALSVPIADAELRAVSDSIYGTRAEGDIRMSGDLAYMTAQLYANATSRDGLTGARLELGRRDPDASLLGPLSASEFQLGDVSTQSMPLGLRGFSGRGAFITNAPLERASLFDTIDLRGDLPDGYDVELYRNNILIGSSRLPVNGQYQFLKVSVDYGLNIFRLVFFGPQGQRREEVRRISVGDGRLSQGDLVYSFGAAQRNINVFNVHGPEFVAGLDDGAWRSTMQLDYGLTKQVTVSLGGAWFESRFGQHWIASAGARTGIGGTAIKLDTAYESGGGTAAKLSLGGRFMGLGYTLTDAEYGGGFNDEIQSSNGDPLRRATELNINTAIKLGRGEGAKVLPIIAQLRRLEYADGRKQTEASLRGSLIFSGLIASNTLNYNASALPGFGTFSQIRGTFDLATLSGSRLHLRAAADYDVAPNPRISGVLLEADYALDRRTLLRGTLGHTLENAETQIGLSASRKFGKFTLAFDGGYGLPTGNYNATLRLGFSFGRNPLNGHMFVGEPGFSTGGAIAIRAYQDANGNQSFDPGEPVIPDVEFNIGSGKKITDASGLTFIGGLGDGTRATLNADTESLPDISLAPERDGVEIIPRAGRIHVTNFALQQLSDIAGTAYFSEGNALGREVSGLRLMLTDAAGKSIARARTEADGTYFFEQIRPGDYTIQIDKAQAANLKIHLTQPVPVTISTKTAALTQVIKVSAD